MGTDSGSVSIPMGEQYLTLHLPAPPSSPPVLELSSDYRAARMAAVRDAILAVQVCPCRACGKCSCMAQRAGAAPCEVWAKNGKCQGCYAGGQCEKFRPTVPGWYWCRCDD